jgi:hypothetical protein
MAKEQPRQFRAGITRRTEDADFRFFVCRGHDQSLINGWLKGLSQHPQTTI